MKEEKNEPVHKFHQKIDITYYDHLKDIYAGRVALIRELEGILGKEQTHDMIRKIYTRRAVDSSTKRMLQEKNPPKNPEEVLEFFKKLLDNPFSKQAQTETFPKSEPGTIRLCTTECLGQKS